MNPSENVVLAKVLAAVPKGAPDQASLRGACGRAYYAAFTTARDALLKSFPMAYSGKDHGRVAALLKSSTDLQVQTAGNMLEQLHDTRKKADYDVGMRARKAFAPINAQTAIMNADSIISEIVRAAKMDKRLFIPSGVV